MSEGTKQIFTKLTSEQQVLVATAVLLDGFDSPFFLGDDAILKNTLQSAAEEILKDAPSDRLPFIATLLRRSLNQLRADNER